MMRLLSDIRRLRKKYNLAQKDLARESGVSQSLIAKIESGTVEPSYSKAINLFQVLEQHQNKLETKAGEVMTKKVITVSKQDSLEQVIKLMKKHNISQIPVLEHSLVCGLVTENAILEKTISSLGRIAHLKVIDVMADAPPMISPAAGLRTVLELLRDSSTVLVMEKGQLQGIISKSNVLGKRD
ncbi:CBS domain-containing protein [Candidatus Woesearchaeota archaeon]|nr:CBS domain-containing protein [Candidatus Woesearchaeota archaeon]